MTGPRPPKPPFPNPWRRLGGRSAYENAWMAVREDEVLTPGGSRGVYGVMSPRGYAIGVLPVFANGDVVLVGQWRYALDAFSWEAPEGGGDKAAPPLDSAKRELLEETGLSAQNWRPLATLHTSNSLTDETAFCFLATDLTQGAPDPDDTEKLAVIRVPFREALQWVMQDDITDALSVAMVLRAALLAQSGALPKTLAAAMLAR